MTKSNQQSSRPSADPRLAVCSWSLKANNPDELINRLDRIGLHRIQFALMPVLDSAAWAGVVEKLTGAGVSIVSGMIGFAGEDYSTFDTIRRTGGVVPDETWETNLASTTRALDWAQAHKLKRVTFHAGFIPPDQSDAQHTTLAQRMRCIADLAEQRGIDILLETGQESADTLNGFLKLVDRANLGVNFDPANMILYGTGEPNTALQKLIAHVRQVHIKDATTSPQPGQWGAEVPAGLGEVDWPPFLRILADNDYRGDLVIEREAGDQRIEDVRTAAQLISDLLG